MFEFCVEFFHFSQVVLDLAVLLYSQLVVKDGRKEADQVAVRWFEGPVAGDHLQNFKWLELVPSLFALHELDCQGSELFSALSVFVFLMLFKVRS